MAQRLVDKVVKARTALLLDHAFFGTVLLKLGSKIDETCPTAYTDGVTVGYNPKFTEALPMDEVKGLLAHEALHYMFKHMLRRGERDPRKWNMAADYVINNILIKAGFKIPEGGLHNPAYDGMTVEHVYNLIPDGGDGQGQDPNGDGSGEGEGWNWGAVRDQTIKDPATGKQRKMTQSEQSKADGEANIAIGQAVMIGRKSGTMPAGLERILDGILEPKINWRTELQRFVQAFSKNDYSYRMPNRGYLIRGLYVPTLFSEEVGPIVTAFDTSGSISDAELRQAVCGELMAIKENVRPEKIVAMYCDSQVYPEATQEFYPEDDIALIPKGGGGTRFTPVFDEVELMDIDPVCLLYFTDGWCSDYPDAEPDYPVLWILTESNDGFNPPFGEVLEAA